MSSACLGASSVAHQVNTIPADVAVVSSRPSVPDMEDPSNLIHARISVISIACILKVSRNSLLELGVTTLLSISFETLLSVSAAISKMVTGSTDCLFDYILSGPANKEYYECHA